MRGAAIACLRALMALVILSMASLLAPVRARLLDTVSVRATNSQDERAGLDRRKEVNELLDDLGREAKQGEPEPFMQTCAAHVSSLAAEIEAAYTHAQLEPTLLHECEVAREFPTTHKHGYASYAACQKFSRDIAAARASELREGRTSAYQELCAAYYQHLSDPSWMKQPADSVASRPSIQTDPHYLPVQPRQRSSTGPIGPTVSPRAAQAVRPKPAARAVEGNAASPTPLQPPIPLVPAQPAPACHPPCPPRPSPPPCPVPPKDQASAQPQLAEQAPAQPPPADKAPVQAPPTEGPPVQPQLAERAQPVQPQVAEPAQPARNGGGGAPAAAPLAGPAAAGPAAAPAAPATGSETLEEQVDRQIKDMERSLNVENKALGPKEVSFRPSKTTASPLPFKPSNDTAYPLPWNGARPPLEPVNHPLPWHQAQRPLAPFTRAYVAPAMLPVAGDAPSQREPISEVKAQAPRQALSLPFPPQASTRAPGQPPLDSREPSPTSIQTDPSYSSPSQPAPSDAAVGHRKLTAEEQAQKEMDAIKRSINQELKKSEEEPSVKVNFRGFAPSINQEPPEAPEAKPSVPTESVEHSKAGKKAQVDKPKEKKGPLGHWAVPPAVSPDLELRFDDKWDDSPALAYSAKETAHIAAQVNASKYQRQLDREATLKREADDSRQRADGVKNARHWQNILKLARSRRLAIENATSQKIAGSILKEGSGHFDDFGKGSARSLPARRAESEAKASSSAERGIGSGPAEFDDFGRGHAAAEPLPHLHDHGDEANAAQYSGR